MERGADGGSPEGERSRRRRRGGWGGGLGARAAARARKRDMVLRLLRGESPSREVGLERTGGVAGAGAGTVSSWVRRSWMPPRAYIGERGMAH